jgi:hypothetical protein
MDHPFPKVPVRQLVLSVPTSLRFRMACSPDLTTAVLRLFIAAITGGLDPVVSVQPLSLENGA